MDTDIRKRLWIDVYLETTKKGFRNDQAMSDANKAVDGFDAKFGIAQNKKDDINA